MICPSCGTENENNALFCTSCGAKLENITEAVVDTAENTFVQEKGLVWAHILGYFLLWLVAVDTFASSIKSISGKQYGDYKDLIYGMYGALKPVDVLYGVFLMVLAVGCVYCAYGIITKKKYVIKVLPLLYLVSAASGLIYVSIFSVIIKQSAFTGETLFSIIFEAVLFFVNRIYFENRKDIFVK